MLSLEAKLMAKNTLADNKYITNKMVHISTAYFIKNSRLSSIRPL